jgi:outer membrane protein assembly factor BamB
MPPAPANGRVLFRRLATDGPELVCLREADGRLLWTAKPGDYVASDPIVRGRTVIVLAVRRDPQRGLPLSLAGLDWEYGDEVLRTEIAEFRDVWQGKLPCRATLAQDRIAATAGGCLVVCDLRGRIAWLRRQHVVIPTDPPAGPQWYEQIHDPPLVADDLIYATQPGMWEVECVELETGRLRWRQAVPELICVGGLVQDRLIVETADEVAALDAKTGRVVWRHRVGPRLDARLCGKPGGILVVEVEPTERPRGYRPMLVWLDPASGTTVARQALGEVDEKQPVLGPLVTQGEQAWGFLGKRQSPLDRVIVELVPAN